MYPQTIGFVSLGCPKALVDSERILTQLRADGYEIASDYHSANLVIVNTCGFVDSAIEESLDAIHEAITENGRVIVTGCLGVKRDLILQKFPQVLSVSGPQAYEQVMAAVYEHMPREQNPHLALVPPQGIKLTPRHYAYLKISEGCNHKCSFCIIPSMRGKLVSRPINEVLYEAERLVSAGVKELLVISQDTSAYGLDLKYQSALWKGNPLQTRFFDLCKALGELGVWIRLHYVYPYPHVDQVIPLMANGTILPYLDIPFQHASPRILKAMRRPANSENNLARVQAWRAICPDISIRSTFIVGFPGETEQEFSELLAFLEEAQLDRVGCFTYSPVEGAAANLLPDQIPEAIKQERYERFMTSQAKISKQKLQKKIGQIIDVIVDQVTEDGIVARSRADAPEIDGLVFLPYDSNIQPGEIMQVKITNTDQYDLHAQQLDVVD